MNLVCFPHYTAGGLLCEIFNNTSSKTLARGGFSNKQHQYGVIQPDAPVLDKFDPAIFFRQIEQMRDMHNIQDTEWIGTHCWPGIIDHTKFNKIINITTCTNRSKIFRWARMFNLYFKPRIDSSLTEMDYVDKVRILATEYVKPFVPVKGNNITNIEFSSIVDFDAAAKNLMGDNSRYDVWKEHNIFLYDDAIWNSDLAKRFYEAEYEVLTGKEYEYQ